MRKKKSPAGIEVSDINAEVPIQNLLDHIDKRLVKMQKEVIDADIAIKSFQFSQAKLILSWGFDGSTGHSNYNQAFSSSETSEGNSDSSLIATTTIPLRLLTEDDTIYWCNRMPQSV